MAEKLCPFNHKLEVTLYKDYLCICDFPKCKRRLHNENGYRCNICDYDICLKCIDAELDRSIEDRMPKYNTYPHTKFCTCWQCRRNDRKNPYTGHNYFCSCDVCFNGPNLSDVDTDEEDGNNYLYISPEEKSISGEISSNQSYKDFINDNDPFEFLEIVNIHKPYFSNEEENEEEIISEIIEDMINEVEERILPIYFKINEKYKTYKNLCTLCGVDMGPSNPRQLCGKWRCLNSTDF